MTSKTNTIVFAAMLSEAEDAARHAIGKGIAPAAAADRVARQMDLTFAEAQALRQKLAQPEAEELPDQPEATLPETQDANSISFATNGELVQAQGILMYRAVPWMSVEGNNLVFTDKAMLDKAHEILKRRWDFVETANRRVAVIEFDSISELEKVVDFMNKQGMLMDFGTSSHDLQDDIIDEATRAQPKTKGKKPKPISEKDISPKDNSFVAVSKERRNQEVNVWENPKQRVIKVRKRWK